MLDKRASEIHHVHIYSLTQSHIQSAVKAGCANFKIASRIGNDEKESNIFLCVNSAKRFNLYINHLRLLFAYNLEDIHA